MSTEANKVLVRRYREAHNTNNLALLDEVVAAGIKSNGGMPGLLPGLQGGKMVHRRFLAAFPDGYVTTEDLIAVGRSGCRAFFLPRHKHRFAHAFTRHRQEGYVFRSVRFPHRKWQDCGTLGRT